MNTPQHGQVRPDKKVEKSIDDYSGTKSIFSVMLKNGMITQKEYKKCIKELCRNYLSTRI